MASKRGSFTSKEKESPAKAFITQPEKTEKATKKAIQPKKEASEELKTARLNIVMKPSTKEYIQFLARANNTSTNDYICNLLEENIDANIDKIKKFIEIINA